MGVVTRLQAARFRTRGLNPGKYYVKRPCCPWDPFCLRWIAEIISSGQSGLGVNLCIGLYEITSVSGALPPPPMYFHIVHRKTLKESGFLVAGTEEAQNA